MLLNVALWAPASCLANHAARHQPSQNFWSAALHHCPERWKLLLVYLSALNGEN